MDRSRRTLAFALAIGVSWPLAAAAGGNHANTEFTVLHQFDGSDGACPTGALVAAPDGAYYGVAESGGGEDKGTLYRLRRNGRFELLHSFVFESDGKSPNSLLLASDGNLYGAATAGTSGHGGTVFRYTPAGEFSVLHTFAAGVSTDPIMQGSDGALYGMAQNNAGATFYRLALDGTFAALVGFATAPPALHGPVGRLAEASPGVFYGAAWIGGAAGGGGLFRVGVDGSFAVLHEFAGAPGDGFQPRSGPVITPDGLLEGATELGGAGDIGTLYAFDGTGEGGLLHSFDDSEGDYAEGGVAVAPDGALVGTLIERNTHPFNLSGAIYAWRDGRLTLLHSMKPSGSEGDLTDGVPLVDGPGELMGVACNAGDFDAGTLWRLRSTRGD